jgi:hypothetical protein
MEGRPRWLLTALALGTAVWFTVVLPDTGYSIQKYDESPGLYYEHKGLSVLYKVEWKTVVYVDMNKVENESVILRQYAHHVEMLCHMSVIRNWTGCAHFGEDLRNRLSLLSRTELLL